MTAHNTVLCSGNVSQAAQWSSLCYQCNGQGLRVNFQMCDKPKIHQNNRTAIKLKLIVVYI